MSIDGNKPWTLRIAVLFVAASRPKMRRTVAQLDGREGIASEKEQSKYGIGSSLQ